MTTLVLQSYRAPPWADWRQACIASVARWAKARGYAYRMIGDELFDPIPSEARAACRDVLLPLTDLGRLLWMDELLSEWERVIWLDSDVLIFGADFRIDAEGVGKEVWISHAPQGGFRASPSVNNAVLSFRSGSTDLARYLKASLEEAERFRAPPHSRALGPDLLRRLHGETPFPLVEGLAMVSPPMMAGLAEGDVRALQAHASVWQGPVMAANLCGSLIEDEGIALQAIRRLLDTPEAIAPAGAPPAVEIAPLA